MRGARHVPAGVAAAAAALAAVTLAAGCSASSGESPAGQVPAYAPSAKPSPGSGGASAAPSAAAAAAEVSAQDRSWLAEAHQGDLAETEAGDNAAKGRATSPAVQSVGAMLASDHTAFDEKIIATASALHIPLPDYLSLDDAEASDRLSTETGSVYDHDFTSSMITSHQKMIRDTQFEISHGSSPEVTGLARQALPVLRKHLAALQSVAAAP